MSADEFSLRPFAVGSLMGVRSFRVTPDGVLTGCMQREPWAPGVNEAICRKPSSSLSAFADAMQRLAASGAVSGWELLNLSCAMTGRVNLRKRPKVQPLLPPPPPTSEPAPHQAGTLDCSCGFYAYFDEGHNPHHHLGNVLGIVEGFGVCTTGTRGFRSSKARIRALVIGEGFTLASAVRANYPDVPVFPTLAAALAEYPLTPVEGAVKPEPTWRVEVNTGGGWITAGWITGVNFGPTLTQPTTASEPPEMTRARALEARRNRNTGPDDQRGRDGHYRRRGAR